MDELLLKIAEAAQLAHEQPKSREMALVITKLDEARLWAKDSIKEPISNSAQDPA